ncbi:hypothetical protein V8B55DRAFT_1590312 [Mucor lusitanicus]|uniref:Ubiquitin-like domain-containing protein n=2 Tax=Mucor circinelloides f. lusitanicus TaxID=29924 RepID=A0A168N7W1_MUCCL|nr:hypothetical protein FB192DRAFT_1437909 [Mucor lusitanicus]OAD05916.1 hypothetical protein MUCCIDRAFT_159613 [Mucor lusitanicus CBS 277.49]
MSASLEIKWNGKRFPVEFSSVKELEQTTVKELKQICERITGVNPRDMKINAFGALMNNDDMPLSVYGLRPGCYVTLKVTKHKKPASQEEKPHHHHGNHHHKEAPSNKQTQRAPPPLPNRSTPTAFAPAQAQPAQPAAQQAPTASSPELQGEALLLNQLQKIQDKIDKDITPQVRKYEKTVKEFLNQPSKTDKEKKKQIYMGAYLGEQLMHVLFDLDGFACGPNNLNARQARKEATLLMKSNLSSRM